MAWTILVSYPWRGRRLLWPSQPCSQRVMSCLPVGKVTEAWSWPLSSISGQCPVASLSIWRSMLERSNSATARLVTSIYFKVSKCDTFYLPLNTSVWSVYSFLPGDLHFIFPIYSSRNYAINVTSTGEDVKFLSMQLHAPPPFRRWISLRSIQQNNVFPKRRASLIHPEVRLGLSDAFRYKFISLIYFVQLADLGRTLL